MSSLVRILDLMIQFRRSETLLLLLLPFSVQTFHSNASVKLEFSNYIVVTLQPPVLTFETLVIKL